LYKGYYNRAKEGHIIGAYKARYIHHTQRARMQGRPHTPRTMSKEHTTDNTQKEKTVHNCTSKCAKMIAWETRQETIVYLSSNPTAPLREGTTKDKDEPRFVSSF